MSDVFSSAVITWQRQHGRQHLPWQNTRDPYRIWLSEIMLQQTQVVTVLPYYQSFLARFPTLQALARADSDEVMALWSGLGYYARARNLHRCAQEIVAKHNGEFPRQAAAMVLLPGIGRSTAAAIAAFAFGERSAILDGNVKRVFCRHFGVEGVPTQSRVEAQLWTLATEQLPDRQIESYTQGLMDLGATVCLRSAPCCPSCPVQTTCVAYHQQRIAEFPARREPRVVPQRYAFGLLIQRQAEVLLEKRADTGIWGGLWSLPQIDLTAQEFALGLTDATTQKKVVACLETHGISAIQTLGIKPKALIKHTFTHFKLQLLPVQIELSSKPRQKQKTAQWWGLNKIAELGLSAPVSRLLSSVKELCQ